MALRDQPYFPLYVQDYLTDERLNSCSAATQGVYIKILCIFHKSENYGGVLLKQKDKQNSNTLINFVCKLSKLLPFDTEVIKLAIEDLLEEEVLLIDGDFMYQKRMIKDNNISLARSNAGKKGGGNPNFVKTKPQTKLKQNTEYEYVNEIIDYLNSICNKNYKKSSDKTKSVISARLKEGFTIEDFKKVVDYKFKQWSSDPQMKDYLRPETLFGTKFESYLQSTKVIIADQKKSEAPDYAKFLRGE